MQSDQDEVEIEQADDQDEAENGSGNNLSQTGDDAQIEEQPSEPVHTVRSILEVKFPTPQQVTQAHQLGTVVPENMFLVDWSCACC